MLLTGAMLRLAGRTQVWKEGWRNLHQSSQSMVRARFRLDGEREPVDVSMSWPASVMFGGKFVAALAGIRKITRGPKPAKALRELGL